MEKPTRCRIHCRDTSQEIPRERIPARRRCRVRAVACDHIIDRRHVDAVLSASLHVSIRLAAIYVPLDERDRGKGEG